jgi:hypothetical protein
VGASRRGGRVRQHGQSLALRRLGFRGFGQAHRDALVVRQFLTQESDRMACCRTRRWHAVHVRALSLCKNPAGKRRALGLEADGNDHEHAGEQWAVHCEGVACVWVVVGPV